MSKDLSVVEMASLVLYASDSAATVKFYRAIGLPLANEQHEDGPPHAAAELGGVHVAVYQAEAGVGDRAPGWRSAGSDFPGFYVDSLDDAAARLSAIGAELLEQHQVRAWGCRIIAEDPDGRAIEINQRGHCR